MGGSRRTLAVALCTLFGAAAIAAPAAGQQRPLRTHDAKLVGTAGQDVFCGLAGDDLIVGRDGDDVLFGDDCGSSLTASSRSADGGDDTLKGGDGDDGLVGDVEDDSLSLLGGPGDDELSAGTGADRVVAGPGNDAIRVADQDQDLVHRGSGRDTVRADSTDLLRGCEEVKRRRTL